ncbi:hypothetical protein AVEN_108148-1 [Araneus ventricosus]|uniref:Uncharacterized protein n=1 Tax=Araneus ventricosus TaxID=182803 RepID=A0A4Y2U9B0_ARAVE|nr:hypothetical protein AVEN_43541-1 [Araneus ventricosus]GBO09599.1 hypothetical protein AVEN_108148-1 [Araneus ventricosus]
MVDPVNSRNAFLALCENLLLRMLVDERRHIRELAVRRIIKARGSYSTFERRRPQTKFKANQSLDMIDWFKCDVTEPPIRAELAVEELKSTAENGHLAYKGLTFYKSTNFHATPNRWSVV